ncbi:hypothetical protein REPUB_Repub12eG0130900 [Reevesia pubescens]
MWRRNPFQEISDSDQSISEKCDNNQSYNQELSSFYLEEDVEVPASPDVEDNVHQFPMRRMLCAQNFLLLLVLKKSDHSCGIGERGGGIVCSMVTKEAEALILLDKNVSSFSSPLDCSKAGKSCKGLLSCSQNCENDVSTKAGEVHERLKANDYGTVDHSIHELLEDFNGTEEKQLEIIPADVEALGHGFIEHSMAELLAEHEEKAYKVLSKEVYVHWVIEPSKVKTSMSPSVVGHQAMTRLLIVCSALFSFSSDEPSCITVKIVSRYLDAKLTVCYCSFVKTIEV